MEAIGPILAEYGLPGAIIIWLIYLNGQKDKRIETLTDQLVAKGTADTEQVAKLTLVTERISEALRDLRKPGPP